MSQRPNPEIDLTLPVDFYKDQVQILRDHIKHMSESYKKERSKCCKNCSRWDKKADHIGHCNALEIGTKKGFYCSKHQRG